MYVDRSDRLVGNAVNDTKQNRFYTGTADGRLMQQKEFCFCEGGVCIWQCVQERRRFGGQRAQL